MSDEAKRACKCIAGLVTNDCPDHGIGQSFGDVLRAQAPPPTPDGPRAAAPVCCWPHHLAECDQATFAYGVASCGQAAFRCGCGAGFAGTGTCTLPSVSPLLGQGETGEEGAERLIEELEREASAPLPITGDVTAQLHAPFRAIQDLQSRSAVQLRALLSSVQRLRGELEEATRWARIAEFQRGDAEAQAIKNCDEVLTLRSSLAAARRERDAATKRAEQIAADYALGLNEFKAKDAEVTALRQALEQAEGRAERSQTERLAMLDLFPKTKEGWDASEWISRTAMAEKRRNDAESALAEARRDALEERVNALGHDQILDLIRQMDKAGTVAADDADYRQGEAIGSTIERRWRSLLLQALSRSGAPATTEAGE